MISVIIPVYQAKEYLPRCVDSWLAQTRKDLEIILVDDGSTDGSAVLCDAYSEKESCIKVLHQKNSGVSAARNAGIHAASGEYIMFTDSDDFVAGDYLEKMCAMQEKTGAELVLCGFHHLYEGADITKVPNKTAVYEMKDFGEVFLDLYEKSYLNMPWNKLFCRSLVGTFEEGLSLGEDLLFNLDYLRKCSRVAVLAEDLCYYIQEESRVTLSSGKRLNRLELGKRICTETERFYQDTWKNHRYGGRILSRYINEILDECEKLPADKEITLKEKLQVIKGYSKDSWIQDRKEEAVLTLPDYKILWPFLIRGMAGSVYSLCVIRRWIVLAVHALRRKR